MRRTHFKWHRGTIGDAKLVDVATKAKVRRCEVYAFWAFLLEAALDSEATGDIRALDIDSVDAVLDFKRGTSSRIMDQMEAAKMVVHGYIRAWKKRQNLRGTSDPTITDRMARYRRRLKTQQLVSEMTGVKADDADTEKVISGSLPPGFRMFWAMYPSSPQKSGIKTCLRFWNEGGLELICDKVVGCLEYYCHTTQWTRENNRFVNKPLNWLQQTPWIEEHWKNWAAKNAEKKKRTKDSVQSILAKKSTGINESKEVRDYVLALSSLDIERARAQLISESVGIDRKKWEFADVKENAFFRVEVYRVLAEEAASVNQEVCDA